MTIRHLGQKQFPALSAFACARRCKSLSDVFLRSELRREDVSDDPFSIDDVSDASWKESHRFLNRKGLAERSEAGELSRPLWLSRSTVPSQRAVLEPPQRHLPVG
jgi:hypothetical protein